MRAVLFHETGGPEVLSIEETDRPEPGEGEVLIRVRAASVNPADWKYRRGYMEASLPAIPGYDGSGTVEESNDDRFSPGDEGFGNIRSTYAEYTPGPAERRPQKPE